MATKTSKTSKTTKTGKKTTNNRRRADTYSRTNAPKRPARVKSDLEMARDKQIMGIALVAVAVLLLVSFALAAETDSADAGAVGVVSVFFLRLLKIIAGRGAVLLPVFLLIFSAALFRRKFARGDILAVVFTLGGISLFFLDQLDGGKLWGNVLAVVAGCMMGLMYLCMCEVNEEERFSSVFLGEAFTVLVGCPFLFTTKVELSFQPILFIFLLGVFQLGVPYILYALAAGKCPPLACSLLAALEPLLNPVWVMLFYGEVPGWFALAGGIVVITTVTVWSVWSGKQKKTAKTG